MKLINVGATTLNQTPLDWLGNTNRIINAIHNAKEMKIELLCLPEMCLTGYGCEDEFHSTGIFDLSWKYLNIIKEETENILVNIGLPILYSNGLFNTSCLIANKKILGFVAKRFLAGDGVHYEPRWFKPWPINNIVTFSKDNCSYPLGDIHFNCNGVKIGFEICEDAWVANRPGASLARKGVDIILNPSASHFAFQKSQTRQRIVIEGSRAFGVTYLYANLLGNESGRVVYDGDSWIATNGKIIASGKRFSYKEFNTISALVDINSTRMAQTRTSSFMPIISETDETCIISNYGLKSSEYKSNPKIEIEHWEESQYIKEEEFSRALSLALFDYLRKSKSSGFVISLSGGADSSAIACLIYLMVYFGVEELGLKAFKEKLSHINIPTSAASIKSIVYELLACVYQATENSSQTTRDAAFNVANAIGANFMEWNIDSIVEKYIETISKSINRELTWEKDDISLQNIQARVRSPGVWFLANIRNALLLSTSNRSEAAVGYATMDGDTSGGLSPIAGIDKFFLRQWLNWMEIYGPQNAHPISELFFVNKQQPTAELRPSEFAQTDESDLMPYDLLDFIERAAIRDKKLPVEVFELVKSEFKQYTQQQIYIWIERFFKLWCRNQWKRERYAPSIHVDDENLDPKTWCRFPILSGGFSEELKELKKLVEDGH